MADGKSTNIVGVPFKQYVRKQIGLRAIQGSTDKRNSDQIMYLANKNCWIRLVSFVNVVSDEKIKEEGDYLARNWALIGGTSAYTKNNNKVSTLEGLRYGIENVSRDILAPDLFDISPNSAYGLGGTNQYGYRPMPGITSATIEHAGTAGSLRIANVKFKVWNINQLNIIDTLYFRLGYSCLLEWGHTSYLDNEKEILQTIINPIDIFNENIIKTKEDVIRKINEKRKETSGNYDAMYGLISNYDWTQSSDGGYECNVKLTGLGSVIDSLKINQAYSMPGGEYKSPDQTTNDNIVQNITPVLESKLKVIYPFIDSDKKYIIWPQLGRSIVLYKDRELNYIESEFIPSVSLNTEFIKLYPPDIIRISYIIDNNIKISGLNEQGSDIEKGERAINYTRLQEISNELNTPFFNPETDRYLPALTTINGEEYLTFITEIELKIPKVFVFNQGDLGSAIEKVAKKIYINISTKRDEKITAYFQDPAISYINMANESASNVSQLDVEAIKIKNPALLQFYFRYLDGNYKTIIDNPDNKYRSTNENLKGISIDIINISPGYSSKTENRLSIGVTLTISDEKKASNRAGLRVQVINEFLNKIYKSIEYQEISFKDSLEITSTIDTNSIFSKDYTIIDNKVSKVFSIANIDYNYDYSKLINQSNNKQGAPTSAIDTVQSTIPYIIMSNIDKFLIELRDKVSENDTINDDEIYTFIENQLKNGVLDKIRIKAANDLPVLTSNALTALNTEKQLGVFIKKGFNSEIISGEVEELSKVKDVDFKELFKVYKPGIFENQSTGLTSKFIYIKLGLLLYYINNSSLFYEKTESKDDKSTKKPFIYIDFNPNSNYCLTTKYHFSVDPGVCLIPVQISKVGYDSLFQEIKLPEDNIKFKPELDFVSQYIKTDFSISGDLDESRGNIMNIAINIDHVLNILLSQTKGNPKSDVLLRSFLETLMEDINKSMGNINMFRVGYYDEGNTVRIYDDQVINAPSGQETVNNKNNSLIVPATIPIVGKNSILRSLDMKTEASTKMSQMIAFSAQAGNFGALNTDSSGLGNLNTQLIDRLLPVKEESSNPKNIDGKSDADDSAAKIFNDHLVQIYNKQFYNNANVDIAKNYYSTAANKLKAEDKYTTAKPVLPISVNLTMDGISGLSILEGFTIPTDLLPERYKDNDGTSKVGFAIVGLNHNIDNNQWITGIKGQMINIPNPQYVRSSDVASIGTGTSKNLNNIISNTSFIATDNQAKKAAEQYLGKSISTREWGELISATYAEASANQTERAYVMAAILNRTRSKSWGDTITKVLYYPGQFQAVTGRQGDRRPSEGFVSGPSQTEAQNIYQVALNLLKKVPTNIINFTAADKTKYGPGTRPEYINELKRKGGFIIGQTIFST